MPYLGPLSLDWVIESQGRNPANPNQWLVVVNLIARGGDGHYTYFHDGLPVNSPRVQIVDRTCRNKPGSFWVQDGTGQIVKKSLLSLCARIVPAPKPLTASSTVIPASRSAVSAYNLLSPHIHSVSGRK